MNQSPAVPSACGCPEFRLGRRRLLGAAAATAGVLAGAELFGESFRQVAYGAESGGNVVVVLSLRGGADGLSMVVPSTAADQDALRQVRPDIVVPAATLIPGDSRFGLHPAFAPLADMWRKTSNFAAVHSVGLPAPNRSHFDSILQIEDASPGDSARTGWINRTVGLSSTPMAEEAIQIGSILPPASLSGPAPVLAVEEDADFVLPSMGIPADAQAASTATLWQSDTTGAGDAVRSMLSSAKRLSPVAQGATASAATATAAAQASSVRTAAYPEGPLADVLANTSALIRANVGVRIVTVDYGDWDMHTDVGTPDAGRMHDQVTHLAGSLKAFFDDLGSAASRVTVVTMSEFGRRVAQNASGGLDHGYGNAMLLLGAGVKGGQVYGGWSGLGTLNDGDVPVQTNFQSVLWEVLSSRFPDVSGSRATIFPGAEQKSLGTMRS